MTNPNNIITIGIDTSSLNRKDICRLLMRNLYPDQVYEELGVPDANRKEPMPMIREFQHGTKRCYDTTIEVAPYYHKALNKFSYEMSDMTLLRDATELWFKEAKVYIPPIKKVIFNPPATIVIWSDGKKTVVKAHNEPFDAEKGLAMCIAERYFGNYSRFKKIIEKNLEGNDA